MPPQTSKQSKNDDALPPGFSTTPPSGSTQADPLSDEALGKRDQIDVGAFTTKWNSLTRQQKEQLQKGLSPDEQAQLYSALRDAHPTGHVTVSPAEKFDMMSAMRNGINDPWVRDKAINLIHRATNYLPAAGGTIGSIAGGAAAAPTVVGEAGGAVAGAALGGAAGEAARQGVEHVMGWDQNDPHSPAQRGKEIGYAAIENTLAELLGQGMGKVMRPTVERAIKKLYYAGGLEHGDPMEEGALESIFPELQHFEKANPVRDTKGLVDLLSNTRKTIGQQVDLTYASPVQQGGRTVMLGNATANVQPLENAVQNLITDYSKNADLHHGTIKMLNALKTKAARPRTYSQLAQWRIDINNNLRGFYAEHAGANQQALLMSRPDLLAEKKIADAIRDVTYPEMDTAAHLPKGTTAQLQKKRGAAIELEKQAIAHRERLLTESKRVAGAAPLKRGNMSGYVTSKGKAGAGIHRVTSILHAPNVLKDADKRAASAFGHTVPQKIGKPASSRAGVATISAVPRVGYDTVRANQRESERGQAGAEAETPPGMTTEPLKLADIKAEAQARKPAQLPKRYALTAVGKDGHTIGTDDGIQWFDVLTGESIKGK